MSVAGPLVAAERRVENHHVRHSGARMLVVAALAAL